MAGIQPRWLAAPALLAAILFGPMLPPSDAQSTCVPTRPDSEGPFYKPNAPERASIGRGLVVAGVVRKAGNCAPIPNARIEWWQVNPQGEYDDAHRATQTADAEGRYRFETIVPALYPGRARHYHVKVQPKGGRLLTTQLYFPGDPGNSRDGLYRPELELKTSKSSEGAFDFVVEA